MPPHPKIELIVTKPMQVEDSSINDPPSDKSMDFELKSIDSEHELGIEDPTKSLFYSGPLEDQVLSMNVPTIDNNEHEHGMEEPKTMFYTGPFQDQSFSMNVPIMDNELGIQPSEVIEILPKCCEFDNQINLLSEAYHLVYGGPNNLLYQENNLIDIKTPIGNNLLHLAAGNGNDNIVSLVTEHAPKLLFKFNRNNDSVLHVAARGGHISTVKKLLATYTNIERLDIKKAWLDYTFANLDDIQDYDDVSNMKDLLKFVRKENNQGNTMLHEGMLSGKKVIDEDDNIFKVCEIYKTEDCFGASLSQCCYEYALDITNYDKESVLYIAVMNGDKNAVKLILKNCPENDARPEGLSPVVAAIMKGDQEMLGIILQNKPTWIHLRDKNERLALHYAASIGYLEGVVFLLGICKCCTIHKEKYGFFPIHLASYGGHVEVVKKLLEYCPDPTEMVNPYYEHNILHIASKYGKHEVVKFILQSQIGEHHKMINQKDRYGDTPLHLASRSCHPTTVYYLTRNEKVELDLVNEYNKTAMDVVSEVYKLDKSSLRQSSRGNLANYKNTSHVVEDSR